MSQSNLGAVDYRTTRWTCMNCGGFAWTLCFSWYNWWYLLDIARLDQYDRSPLCWYPSLGSWFVYVFNLTCHIILDTFMNLPTHTYRLFHSLDNYIFNYGVGVELFARAYHKIDLLSLVWTWKWDLVEISSASTLASFMGSY